jgi:hypothetical protein
MLASGQMSIYNLQNKLTDYKHHCTICAFEFHISEKDLNKLRCEKISALECCVMKHLYVLFKIGFCVSESE